jgi:hypothetical protein
MRLLAQHLVELPDPELVAAGVAPVRAVILLLHMQPPIGILPGVKHLRAADTAA